jgi:hypothetical protein
MFVCCECCVLSGRGLCGELITRPEEAYRLWCVVVCDLRNLKIEEAMIRSWVAAPHKKKLLLGGGHCDYSPGLPENLRMPRTTKSFTDALT